MTILHITEFSGLVLPKTSPLTVTQAPLLPKLAEQKLSIGTTSAQSTTLNELTKLVRVISDIDCFFEVAPNPMASSTTAMKLVADQEFFFTVNPGSSLKIAVIQEV